MPVFKYVIVNVAGYVNIRFFPFDITDPGRMMIIFVPNDWNWFSMYFLSPTPKEMRSTTDKTPIRMPSDVRKVRPLFFFRSSSAVLIRKSIPFINIFLQVIRHG